MAGIKYIKSNNSTIDLSGSNYTGLTNMTAALYVKTGTAANATVKYGLTTDTTASAYSPKIRLNGTDAYIASQSTSEATYYYTTEYETATRPETYDYSYETYESTYTSGTEYGAITSFSTNPGGAMVSWTAAVVSISCNVSNTNDTASYGYGTEYWIYSTTRDFFGSYSNWNKSTFTSLGTSQSVTSVSKNTSYYKTVVTLTENDSIKTDTYFFSYSASQSSAITRYTNTAKTSSTSKDEFITMDGRTAIATSRLYLSLTTRSMEFNYTITSTKTTSKTTVYSMVQGTKTTVSITRNATATQEVTSATIPLTRSSTYTSTTIFKTTTSKAVTNNCNL